MIFKINCLPPTVKVQRKEEELAVGSECSVHLHRNSCNTKERKMFGCNGTGGTGLFFLRPIQQDTGEVFFPAIINQFGGSVGQLTVPAWLSSECFIAEGALEFAQLDGGLGIFPVGGYFLRGGRSQLFGNRCQKRCLTLPDTVFHPLSFAIASPITFFFQIVKKGLLHPNSFPLVSLTGMGAVSLLRPL